jgi:hypothetical protein
MKSRLPIRENHKIARKVQDLYGEQVGLMKHRSRSNEKDQFNQKQYCEKLDHLFDISHANAEQLITNEEDRQFLKLQRESRTGCIGSVDKKLLSREKRATERRERFAKRVRATASIVSKPSTHASVTDDEVTLHSQHSSSSSEDEHREFEFVPPRSTSQKTKNKCKRKDIISQKVSAVLDRTSTSIRTSTMILASVVNEVGCATPSTVLSKSTVHRQRQRYRRKAAEQIKNDFVPCKSVVHWDGKMLPDVTGEDHGSVDRLPVLISSLVDGSTKLLGVPKSNGSGWAAADAVIEQLKSWKCESLIVGICFDTTACNTGRINGACTFIEEGIGRNLLWMACRHHMFEVLLSDAFGVCLGPSTGPDILFFKRFRDNWSELRHRTPRERQTPLIPVNDDVKTFITEQRNLKYPRADYQEFLNLAASVVGLKIEARIQKPGALHRARWMAKAIYSLKIELLSQGNEAVLQLTARELKGIQRFNRFVVCVYMQSWFSCRFAADAPINDISLITHCTTMMI